MKKKKDIIVIFAIVVFVCSIISGCIIQDITKPEQEKSNSLSSLPLAADPQDVTNDGTFSQPGQDPWNYYVVTDDPGDDYASIPGDGYAYLHIKDNVFIGSDNDEEAGVRQDLLRKYTVPEEIQEFHVSAYVEFIFSGVSSFDGSFRFYFNGQISETTSISAGSWLLEEDFTISISDASANNYETDYSFEMRLLSDSLNGGYVEAKISSVFIFVDCYDSPITAPGQVTLVSPADGSYCTDTYQTFHWDSESGATQYQIQLDDDKELPALSTQTTTSTARTLNFPSNNDYYYWRVRAGNIHDMWGDWSSYREIRVDCVPPGTPSLISPSNGFKDDDPTMYLQWSTVTGGYRYHVQVDDSSDFTSPAFEKDDCVSGSWTTSSLPDDTYYWHVRARDIAGNWGSWSSYRTFIVDTIGPLPPVLVSPSNGALLDYDSPLLDWNTASGADSYQVELDGIPHDTSSTSYQCSSLSEGSHSWRVRADDDIGNWGDWSSPRSFTIDTIGPNPPSLVSPSNGDGINDKTPFLDWSTVGDAVNYRVDVDGVSYETTSTSYTWPTSLTEGSHSWKVQAQDAAGNWGNWGDTSWSFIVDTIGPPPPDLVTPSNGIKLFDSTPYFNWDPSTGAVNYRIEVDSVSYETTSTSYTWLTSLSEGSHTWHVQAQDTVGNWGDWSPTWTLTIDTIGPNPPNWVSPLNGGDISDSTPLLEWSTVGDAINYRVEVDGASYETVGTSYTWSTPLSDGIHNWRVQAQDDVGNWGSWSSSWSFNVDTVGPPPPDLVSPSTGLKLGDNSPFFDWDPSTGAVNYRIEVDSVSYETTSTSYTWLTSLSEGSHTWHVQAQDTVGNWGDWSPTWTFTIDTIGPSPPVCVSPLNGGLTNDETPLLVWTAVGDGINYRVEVDGVSYETTGTSYEWPTSLSEGGHSWRVQTQDDLGNWGDWSSLWTFSVDTIGPSSPDLVSPLNGMNTDDSTPLLDWTAVGDAVNYRVEIDGVSYETTGTSYIWPISLSEGGHSWHVQAQDAAGNWGGWSSSWTFSVDLTGPSPPGLISPSNGLHIDTATPLLEWSAVGDAVNYRVEVDGVSYETTSTSYTWPTFLSEGSHSWRVQAQDAVGNWGDWSSSWTFTIDELGPPAPDLVSPSNGLYINDPTPSLEWTAVGTAVNYRVEIDGTSHETTNTNYIWPTSLSDGSHTWRVQAQDAVGNWGNWSLSQSFTVDTVGPTPPNLLSPSDGVYISDSTPLLEWSAIGDAVNYRVEVDGISYETSGTSYTWPTSLTDSSHSWHVQAQDAVGNWGDWSLSQSFTVDRIGPNPPDLVSPSNGLYINDETPLLEWTSIIDAVNYRVEIDGISYETTGTSYIWPISLSEGSHSWHVQAQDAVGNWGDWSTSRTFTVDTIGPISPTLLSPSDGLYIDDETPLLEWSAVGDAVNYRVEIDGVSFETAGTSYTWFTSLSDGSHSWHVQAQDAVGNWGDWSTSRTFTVDTVGPLAPTLLSPSNQWVIDDDTPLLEWSTVLDAVNYRVEVDGVSYETVGTSYTWPTSLSDGSHSWHVQAQDTAGNWGTWSTSLTFTVDRIGPTPPDLTSPSDGIHINDSTPLLEWSAVGDAENYRIYFADNSGFTGFSYYETGDTTTLFELPYQSDGTYYWKIQAEDSIGNWGSNSSVFSFTIDVTPPDVPTLRSPSDGILIADATPQFEWFGVSGASHYRIQVSSSISFDDPLLVDVVTSNTFHLSESLPDTTLYWRVCARDSAGNWGDFSGHFSFMIYSIQPTPPTLISPTNSSTIDINYPNLDWDDILDATQYHIEVADSNSFLDLIVDEITTDSNFTSMLPLDGTYYWRVRSENTLGSLSDFSQIWIFNIDTTAPRITIQTPDTDTQVNSGNQVNWNIQDISIIVNISYSWDSEFYDFTFSGSNYPVIPNGDGLHILYMYAEDFAGNSIYTNFEFITDDTNPTATFSGIFDNIIFTDLNTITVYPTDTGFDVDGIDRVEFYVNGNLEDMEYTDFVFSWNTANGEYPDGDYEVKFIVYDNAGNIFEKKFTVMVQNGSNKSIWQEDWIYGAFGVVFALPGSIAGLVAWIKKSQKKRDKANIPKEISVKPLDFSKYMKLGESD